VTNVAVLLLREGRIKLDGNTLPGGPIAPDETPEAAIARLVPEALNPRLLATHHDGSLHLLYVADTESTAGIPLSEAFGLSLSSVADYGVRLAMMGFQSISRPRAAAYGVIVEEGRLLLCRLSAFESSGGAWTLPGGGLEFGEHPEAGAVREVKEETGLDVELGELLEIQSEVHPAANGPMHSLRFLYRARAIGGTLTCEFDGTTDLVRWHTEEEARRLKVVPLAARAIELAFA
jgi:8-oxo-dGTP diphosphatase